MRVGYIGLGNMGNGMASNLLKAGHEVFVWSRTSEKAEAMQKKGAVSCSSPIEVASKVDIVMACLIDEQASRNIFLNEYSLISNAREGQIFVDHATVSPNLSRIMYKAAIEKKAHFLDAPISGGPDGAAKGTLAIMVGGDEDPFNYARPVFEAMGKTVLHMGKSGAGAVTKIINQLLVGVNGIASCEAFLLASKAGVDLSKLWGVLQGAWGGSTILNRNAPYIIEKEFGPSSAPIRNMYKDMSIGMQVAKDLDLSLPTAKAATVVFDYCKQKGLSLEDLTAVYQLIENNEV